MNKCVGTKIPIIIPDESLPEVVSSDQTAKEKIKKYADKLRKTCSHDIRNGDTVLVRQRRNNILSTPFEPIPYIVERVKGTMITASRKTDHRQRPVWTREYDMS